MADTTRNLALLATLLLIAAMAEVAFGPTKHAEAPFGVIAAPGTDPVIRPADAVEAQSAAVLARPLFSPERQPSAAVAGAAAPATSGDSLPRLTAIIVGGGKRRALFAAAADPAHLLVVEVGGELDGYRVAAINPGGVTLAGPAGLRTIGPLYADEHAAPVASPLAVLLPGIAAPSPEPDPARFDAVVGAAGMAMYRFSPAAPRTPPPVADALTAR